MKLLVLSIFIAAFAHGEEFSEDEIWERHHYRSRRQSNNNIPMTMDNAEFEDLNKVQIMVKQEKAKGCLRCKRHQFTHTANWHKTHQDGVPDEGNVNTIGEQHHYFTHSQQVMDNPHKGNRNNRRSHNHFTHSQQVMPNPHEGNRNNRRSHNHFTHSQQVMPNPHEGNRNNRRSHNHFTHSQQVMPNPHEGNRNNRWSHHHFTHSQQVMPNPHAGNRNNGSTHSHHHHRYHNNFTHNCEWHRRHGIPMPNHLQHHCSPSTSSTTTRTTARTTTTTPKTTTISPTTTTTTKLTPTTKVAPSTTITPTTTMTSVFCDDLIRPKLGGVGCDQEISTSESTTVPYWQLFDPRRREAQYEESWVQIK